MTGLVISASQTFVARGQRSCLRLTRPADVQGRLSHHSAQIPTKQKAVVGLLPRGRSQPRSQPCREHLILDELAEWNLIDMVCL